MGDRPDGSPNRDRAFSLGTVPGSSETDTAEDVHRTSSSGPSAHSHHSGAATNEQQLDHLRESIRSHHEAGSMSSPRAEASSEAAIKLAKRRGVNGNNDDSALATRQDSLGYQTQLAHNIADVRGLDKTISNRYMEYGAQQMRAMLTGSPAPRKSSPKPPSPRIRRGTLASELAGEEKGNLEGVVTSADVLKAAEELEHIESRRRSGSESRRALPPVPGSGRRVSRTRAATTVLPREPVSRATVRRKPVDDSVLPSSPTGEPDGGQRRFTDGMSSRPLGRQETVRRKPQDGESSPKTTAAGGKSSYIDVVANSDEKAQSKDSLRSNELQNLMLSAESDSSQDDPHIDRRLGESTPSIRVMESPHAPGEEAAADSETAPFILQPAPLGRLGGNDIDMSEVASQEDVDASAPGKTRSVSFEGEGDLMPPPSPRLIGKKDVEESEDDDPDMIVTSPSAASPVLDRLLPPAAHSGPPSEQHSDTGSYVSRQSSENRPRYDPYSETMWPYPNASEQAAIVVKRAAEDAFGPRNFGTVEFDNFNKAWFIRIKSDRDKEKMPDIMIDFVNRRLKYELPRLLVSVTGGALNFELSKELEAVLKRGLRKAAEATNAWIVTGGSDCGIMKYTGQAMSEIGDGIDKKDDSDRTQSVPVIGIATWGILRERVVFDRGGAIMNHEENRLPASRTCVGLDNNHNVFFLFDNGTEGKFGQETDLRSHFESAITKMTYKTSSRTRQLFKNDADIFSVLIVVEGGPITLTVVSEAIDKGTPVVVIDGSGRMADVISYAYRYLHDTSPEGRYLSIAGLRMQIRKLRDPRAHDWDERVLPALQERVLDLVLMPSQVTIYSLEEDKRDDVLDGVDHAMLESIIRSLKIKYFDPSREKLKKSHELLLTGLDPRKAGVYDINQTKLFLTLIFNRDENAKQYLTELRTIARDVVSTNAGAKDAIERKLFNDLGDALMWALSCQRTQFVMILCPMLNNAPDNIKTDADEKVVSSLHDFLFENECDVLNKIFSTRYNKRAKPYLEVLYEKTAGKFNRDSGRAFGRATMRDETGGRGEDGMRVDRMDTLTSGQVPERGMTFRERSLTLKSGMRVDICNIVNRLILKTLFGPRIGNSINDSESGGNVAYKVIGYKHSEQDTDKVERYTNATNKKLRADRAYQDLMIWAVIAGYDSLAEFFWQQGGNSISAALFASVLLARLARTSTLGRHSYFKEVVRHMTVLSDRFEMLAIGVLDHCYAEDTAKAQAILRVHLHHLSLAKVSKHYRNCLELAVHGKRLRFVAHPACLAQIDKEWYGAVDPQNDSIVLFFNAITFGLPILLDILLNSKGHVWSVRFKGDDASSAMSIWDEVGTEEESGGAHVNRRRSTGHDLEADVGDLETMQKGSPKHSTKLQIWITFSRLFYSTPAIKFMLDVISFLVLVVLYAVMLLGSFDNLDGITLTILVWISVMTVEEFTQVMESGFSGWLHEHWNILDAIVYSLFWIGFGLRCWATVGDDAHGWVGIRAAKLVHALGFIALFCRTFRFYFISSNVGPKIMMILNMGSDLITFLALFVIVWLSYGTAQAALLNPDGINLFDRTAQTTWNEITFHPYFQIFGELMLDQLEEETQCLGPEPFNNCGDSLQEFVPVLAGIYFFLTNIVLINLLIAMMAKTFSADDEESHQLYYMQKYDLLIEYGAEKSRFPNPFSIIKPLYEMFRSIKQRLQHKPVHNKKSNIDPICDEDDGVAAPTESAERRMKKDRYRQLESFQEKNTERHAEHQEALRNQTDSARIEQIQLEHDRVRRYMEELHTQTQRLDFCVNRTFEKVGLVYDYSVFHTGELLKRMAEVKSLVFSQKEISSLRDQSGYESDSSSMDYHVLPGFESRYEEELQKPGYSAQATEYLAYLQESLIEYGHSPDRSWGNWKHLVPLPLDKFNSFKHPKLGNIFFVDENLKGEKRPADGKLLICYEAELDNFISHHAEPVDLLGPRTAEGEIVKRAEVPGDCMSWDIDYPEYDPPYYTSPYTLYFSEDCTANSYFKWAATEDPDPTQLMSHWKFGKEEPTQFGSDGLPLNPFGRTGLRGRGLLGKWGPNIAHDQIVTRWKRTANNMQCERNGKPVLEVLLCKRKMGGEWALPGCFQIPADGVNPVLRKVFGLDEASLAQNEDLQRIQKILTLSKTFYKGQTCDARDTDNAWVESCVTHVHDNTGMLKDHAMTDPMDPAIQFVTWAVVHKEMKLFANHVKILENLSLKLDAFWE